VEKWRISGGQPHQGDHVLCVFVGPSGIKTHASEACGSAWPRTTSCIYVYILVELQIVIYMVQSELPCSRT